MGAQAARLYPDLDEEVSASSTPSRHDLRRERLMLATMCAPSSANDNVGTARRHLLVIVGIAAGGWAVVFGAGALLFG